jgi:SAM-dependent methyltransferase
MANLDLNFTLLGRYSDGETCQSNPSHPIVQFLSSPAFDIPSGKPLEFNFDNERRVYCSVIPKDALMKPSRIDQEPGNDYNILDVGCSFGFNTLLVENLIKGSTKKRVHVKGYEREPYVLEKLRIGDVSCLSMGGLLHPFVRESVLEDFDMKKVHVKSEEECMRVYEFSPKDDTKRRLMKKVSYGDALKIPEPDGSSNATICAHVLRHNSELDQLRILKELMRVTKVGGYIFTEDHTMKRTEYGVEGQRPMNDVAVSLYDPRIALDYYCPCSGPQTECIFPMETEYLNGMIERISENK